MNARTGMFKACLATVAVAGVAVALAGCGAKGSSPMAKSAIGVQATTAKAGSGGTLIVGMTASAIPALDTVEAGGQGYEGFRFVGNQLYDGLTRFSLDSTHGIPQVVSDLATSWKPNATATEWTFQLRPNVKFTDGTPWNAAAAAFNFERYLDPSFKYTSPTLVGLAATYIGAVKSFKVLGPMTFQVTTKIPDPHLPEDLTTVYMASPTAVQKEGVNGFGAQPVGTGPFMFQSESQGQASCWCATRTIGAGRRSWTSWSSSRSPIPHSGPRRCARTRSTGSSTRTRMTSRA